MRLSEAISRKILNATVGKLLYKFGGRGRRHTLFFEDIFAEYVKICQDAEYTEQLREIGIGWMGRLVQQRLPRQLTNLPPIMFLNVMLGPSLVNLGLVDSLLASRKDNFVSIKTDAEGATRIIGRNEVTVGAWQGILGILYGKFIEPIEINQSKKQCKYIYRITDTPFTLESKDIKTYNILNEFTPVKGYTLEDALKSKMFTLGDNNKIYFRERSIGSIESTVFHLFGEYGILIDKVPYISHNYFKEAIDKKSSAEEKLVFLKKLLQIMGWGIVTIVMESDKLISIEIKNPPYGLQTTRDNWNFFINVILGYLWTMDEFKITSVEERYKRLLIEYSVE